MDPDYLRRRRNALNEVKVALQNNPHNEKLLQKQELVQSQLDFAEKMKRRAKENGDDYLTSEDFSDMYYHTLGEFQARDVAARFIRSKQRGEEAYRSLPETSRGVLQKPYVSLKEVEGLTGTKPSFDEGWLNQVGGE